MAYIVTKQNRFYVVTYDGINPTTGKEQRRWHLAGESRDDAEAIAANLDRARSEVRDGEHSAATVTEFINETWIPRARRPSPTLHGSSVSVDDRPLHRSSDRPSTAPRPQSRAPRTSLPRPSHDRSNERHRARTQDRLRRPRHHALRAQARRAHPSRRAQRRPGRRRTPPNSASEARTRVVDLRPAPAFPHRHATPPSLPRPSPRRDDRDATRRSRRAPLGRLEPDHACHLRRPRSAIHRWSKHRGFVQDEEQSPMHRPRPAHRNRPHALATSPTARRTPGRAERSDLHEHPRQPRASRVRQPTLHAAAQDHRPPDDPISRPAPHPRHTACRVAHPDQSRLRTTRALAPRIHHGHLSTRDARHGCGGRVRVRHRIVDAT